MMFQISLKWLWYVSCYQCSYRQHDVFNGAYRGAIYGVSALDYRNNYFYTVVTNGDFLVLAKIDVGQSVPVFHQNASSRSCLRCWYQAFR